METFLVFLNSFLNKLSVNSYYLMQAAPHHITVTTSFSLKPGNRKVCDSVLNYV